MSFGTPSCLFNKLLVYTVVGEALMVWVGFGLSTAHNYSSESKKSLYRPAVFSNLYVRRGFFHPST